MLSLERIKEIYEKYKDKNVDEKTKKELFKIDFSDKYNLLDYPEIIEFLIKNEISFEDNQYELIEIAILTKKNDALFLLLNIYPNVLQTIFKPGFQRKNLLLENDNLDRMAPLYLIEEKIVDETTLSIIFYFYPNLKYYYFKAFKENIQLKYVKNFFRKK